MSIVFLLILQFSLIGWSIYVLSGGFGKPNSSTIAVQTTCLIVNLLCAILVAASH
jgi:hypothetical protein